MVRDATANGRFRRLAWPAGGAAALVVILAATLLVVRLHRTGPSEVSAALGQSVTGAAAPSPSAATTPSAVPPASGAPASPARTTPSPTRDAAAPARFGTLRPGATLPAGAQCASWVRARPSPENKGANRRANQVTGHGVGTAFFGGDDPKANSRIAPRVDGQFTGSTRDILRWAACKWGADEDLVLAQAAIESWWRQDTLGDWTADAARCAPGRGLGVDGRPGECPESFGILQNRYPYEKSAWPGIANSTAMNADLAYAIWRTCYEGYELWLNTVERGRDYAAGDEWGCVGRWFSGRWHVPAGDGYVDRVRGYLNQRIWETPNFQQP